MGSYKSGPRKTERKRIAAPSRLTRRREKMAGKMRDNSPTEQSPTFQMVKNQKAVYSGIWIITLPMRYFRRFVSVAAQRKTSQAGLSGSAYFVNRSHCARTESRAPRVLALTTSQLTKG
jgi:hypothetical protein